MNTSHLVGEITEMIMGAAEQEKVDMNFGYTAIQVMKEETE